METEAVLAISSARLIPSLGGWAAFPGGVRPLDRCLSKLAELPKEAVRLSADPAITVSPDGRSILYVQIDRPEHDIMLVENFR